MLWGQGVRAAAPQNPGLGGFKAPGPVVVTQTLQEMRLRPRDVAGLEEQSGPGSGVPAPLTSVVSSQGC